jgi:cell shape-determining protein MreC
MQDPEARHPAHPLLAVGLCLAAIGLTLLPSRVGETIRSVFRDAATPGALAIAAVTDTTRAVRHRLFGRSDLEARIAVLESTLADERRRARQLELVAARADEESPGEDAPPLVVPDLLPARILGAEAAEAWRAGRFVDVGLADGIREETAVLAEEGPLVDRGRDAGLAVGHAVLDGRTLVGRIRSVGRWTSVVQPLTDPEYRTQVRIARRTSRGLVLGPTGILRGTGAPACRIDFVGSTEAVAVGDEVYTVAATNGTNTNSVEATAGDTGAITTDLGILFVGRITSADLPTGAPHWELAVTPAATNTPERVAVLRRRFNPERILE